LIIRDIQLKLILSTDPQFEPYKTQLLNQANHLSPLYQTINIKYYQCYFQLPNDNISFCIEIGKKAILLVLLSPPTNNIISYNNLPIKFIWLNGITAEEIKGANKVAINQIKMLMEQYNASVKYQEYASPALSEFGRFLLKNNYSISTTFQQKINLTCSIDSILSAIRKIFRANIRWGEENLSVKLIDKNTIVKGDILDFMQLHINASGKKTRSDESWHIQEQMIFAGEAFALYGYLDSKLVTAGFFPMSKTECYYGVGASERALFDKSLAHVIIWKAINHAKEIRCNRFDFGESNFAKVMTNGTLPTQKELSIAHFKQGFGGDLSAILNFRIEQHTLG